jgi:hypothetical protein
MDVEIALTPLVRQLTQYPWVNSYPNITSDFTFSHDSTTLTATDTKSAAVSVFGTVGAADPSGAGGGGGIFASSSTGGVWKQTITLTDNGAVLVVSLTQIGGCSRNIPLDSTRVYIESSSSGSIHIADTLAGL